MAHPKLLLIAQPLKHAQSNSIGMLVITYSNWPHKHDDGDDKRYDGKRMTGTEQTMMIEQHRHPLLYRL